MVLEIQILSFMFGTFMIYYSFIRLKRKEFTKREFIFWIMIWAMFIVATMVPEVLNPYFKKFNFARKLDAYIVAGFMFLVGITFYNYILTRKNQRQIESIVRKIAFEKEKK